jgi:hypothetical protein
MCPRAYFTPRLEYYEYKNVYTFYVSVPFPVMAHEGPKHVGNSVHRSISMYGRQAYKEG